MITTNIIKSISNRSLLPNLITCASLTCGITAIRLGIDGDFHLAVTAIILSMVLDALDGRIARAIDGTSEIGAELDSLADLINFGVAPGVVIWLWSLHALGNTGWLVVILFALACCMRLARFNVSAVEVGKPGWKAKYFTGVNAPAGAALSLVPLYLSFSGFASSGTEIARYVAIYIAIIAGLMVSRTPTFSFKKISLTPSGKIASAISLLALATALYLHPWFVLLAGSCIYILMIPFSIACHRRDACRESEGEAQAEPGNSALLRN